ncbi:PREDICTED: uncharacterized protein LOC104705120 [Camelina sativa]|uniref:Uncharacterized protein LOC104705120 n=1 Tax=Camelina sativa TaxID=90675 RepID=A0ABM0T1C2_CAMSA|nr:PREDICTED: uncharacterized protein LOC104705120 [Camelina sativa]
MVDYRPIALCSVFYKIISKLLSRRLQPVLHAIISENQSAFVPQRAISDNVLIPHESLHYLKTSRAKERCFMAVKTDMSKAYNRLEWDFILSVMERMGFHQKWIQWIHQCVSTVSYSFLINGSSQGHLTPSRGLRQGDPLSPYLFIQCSEALSGLCRKAQQDGTLPASGQLINKTKSAITFSSKTREEVKVTAQQILGIQRVGGLGKYLGLPEFFGKKKRDMFNLITYRIGQRSRSWAARPLSTAGKATMLRSVLSAMPMYTMPCFKIPGSLSKRIQSMLTQFWWDSSEENKKISWVAWSKLTKVKKEGGLGFRDIPNFNDALLAKSIWRILTRPNSLLARVLLGKYCNSTSFLECNAPNSASHGWRGICIGRDLLKPNLGKLIGSGQETLLWYEPWISLSQRITPMGPPSEMSANLWKTWDHEKVKALLPAYEKEILALQPSKKGARDCHLWLLTSSGIYTAKSGYLGATQKGNDPPPIDPSPTPFDWYKEIWNIRCLPKLKFFLWKAMHDALPVGENLKIRGGNPSTSCPHCLQEETVVHLFFHCPFAAQPLNPQPPELRREEQRSDPHLDTISYFTDAAWRSDSQAAGFGWLFSDDSRSFEITNQKTATNVVSPILAEAIAVSLTLQHALDLGFNKLSLASDSEMLIKAINSETPSKELYGILHDILDLSLSFS